MLVVVNQPHTEGFRVEGDIPSSVIDFLKSSFGSENVSTDDEYIDINNWQPFKDFVSQDTPGSALKFYRTRDNLTQAQLAAMLETTRQDISGMERNTRPISKKTAKELARIFRTSPASFI